MIAGPGAGIDAGRDRSPPAALAPQAGEQGQDEFAPPLTGQEILQRRYGRLIAMGHGDL